MVSLSKHTIHGRKGKTVCYTLEYFRFDETESKLKWDSFPFYTPHGTETDEQNFKYIDVPADEIGIQRDPVLDKDFLITITVESGVEVFEILEGAEGPTLVSGANGDIVATGNIPADTSLDIKFDYKEVSGG